MKLNEAEDPSVDAFLVRGKEAWEDQDCDDRCPVQDIADTCCRGELIDAKLCDLLQHLVKDLVFHFSSRLRKTKSLNSLSIAYNVLEPRPLRRIARALSACAPLLR